MLPAQLIRPAALHRAEAGVDRRVTWLELFFDLVFAAAVADIGSALSADYTPAGLIRFAFLFFLIWWAWTGHTFFSTRYDHDDAIHRLLTLGQMFLVAVMSVNAKTDITSREAAGFAAAYGGLRFLLAVQFARVRRIPETRGFATSQTIGIGVGGVIWLLSAAAPAPERPLCWGVAMTFDLLTPLWSARLSPGPSSSAHLPERFGLFTLLLLGESVVAIMAGMRHQEVWTAAAAGASLLGLMLVFSLWLAYFEVLGAAAPKPARTGADRARLRLWMTAHLPLGYGIAVSAIGVEHTIRSSGAGLLGVGAVLLGFGVGITVLMLGVLAVTSPEGLVSRPARVLAGYASLAFAVLPIGLVGAALRPVWLLLAVVVVVGIVISLEYRRRSIPAESSI